MMKQALCSSLLVLVCSSGFAAPTDVEDAGASTAANHPQIDYLLGQIPSSVSGWAPNETLTKTSCHPFRDCCCPDPDPGCPACGFVLFRGDVYDQALAIIALVEAGEVGAARGVLDGLQRLMADGLSDHLDSFYIIEQGCGSPPSYTSIYPAGDAAELTARNAWVLQAINYYESRTCDAQYAVMAEDIARWIDSFRQEAPSSCPTLEAISMGLDLPVTGGTGYRGPGRVGYAEHLRRERSAPLARGSQSTIPYSRVYNAEANYVAHVALLQRSWLTRDPDLAQELAEGAQGSKDFVVDVLWSENTPSGLSPPSGPGRFFAAVDTSSGCQLDPVAHLDNQAWSSLALGPYGPDHERLLEGLGYALDNLASDGAGGCPDFSTPPIAGFGSSEDSTDFVWLEGNEIVVSACAFVGAACDPYHLETSRAITPSGDCLAGVLYATDNLEGFEECQGVSSTVWYYLNDLPEKERVFEYGRTIGATLNVAPGAPSSEVILSWAPDGTCPAAAYNVYRGTSPTEVLRPENLLGMQPSTIDTTYRDPVLTDGASYYYRIQVASQP